MKTLKAARMDMVGPNHELWYYFRNLTMDYLEKTIYLYIYIYI